MKNTYKLTRELSDGSCEAVGNTTYTNKALAVKVAKELARLPRYIPLSAPFVVAFWVESVEQDKGLLRVPAKAYL